MKAPDSSVVTATRLWVERVVVGLHLCPFAGAPAAANRVRYAVSHAVGDDALYRDFLREAHHLWEADPAEIETTLLIVPKGLGDFGRYLDILALFEDAVRRVGLEGHLQLASFHPAYRFAGSSADDPANYTNRSPFPMFHLIREAGLQAALESYPDAASIPERNVAHLRERGLAAMRGLLQEICAEVTDGD